jgi:hypothetical protein
MISERIKYQHYKQYWTNNYFWRTYDQQEIDWVEEREGEINGFEFKLSETHAREPVAWRKTYPRAGFTVINRDNYSEWLD